MVQGAMPDRETCLRGVPVEDQQRQRHRRQGQHQVQREEMPVPARTTKRYSRKLAFHQ
jgi:hypothetical protein